MGNSIGLLHVDDDPSFRGMTAKFLSQETDQFEIIEAGTGAEARERLHENAGDVDCLVSDYALPDMTGVELLETVREEYPDLPFVLFTGKGSEAVARDALRAGATDYVQKQSGTEQYDLLANRVRNAVEQSRTERRVVDLERVRALVGNVNQGLVRASSVDDIETTVCELFSESDPYVTACIAGVDTETMQIEPRTWAGADQEYFERFEMSVSDDTPGRQAPGGRAYHDREVAVSQDIRNDSQYEQWREMALEQGFEALAVVPLEYEDTLYGLLAIFASSTYAFDEAETEILTELGDDIGHALNAHETRADLRQTASRLEALFERSPDMINVHDADGNIVDSNPKLCERTGYAADELTEMKVWGLDETIDPDEAFALWERMDVGDSHRRNGVYQCRDGSTFLVEVHLRRLNLEGHDRFVAISREIAERKERERERNRRIDLFEKAQDIGNVGAWEYDVQTGHSVITDETLRIHGLPTDTVLTSESSLDFYHPDDRPQVREAFETAVQDGETYDLEVRLITDDGEQRWVRTRGNPQAEDGEIVRIRGTIKDITERKEQERKREQIISRVTDAIVEVDADWQFTLVNDQAEEVYDMREADLLGRSFWDVFSQARDTWFEDEYRSVMETRESTSIVEYYPGLDGWFDVQVYPNDDGGVAFYFKEVTERQRQQRRFEAVFDNTYQFTGFLDPDGTLLEANEAALSFGGLDRDEVVGKPLWETDWFQSSEDAQETAKKAVEQARGGEMFRDEIRVQGDDREAVIDFLVRPVTDEQGEVTSLIPEGRDITERKRREAELAESEARYRTLAENFPNGGVFFFDDDLQYQIVSGSGFDPIDTGPEDLVGNTIYEVEPYSEETIEILEQLMQATLRGTKESIELNYEGQVYQLRSVPIRDDGEVVAGIYITQDITEQREREEELQRQNERLEKFASVVSHDLRNPLNMVEGRLELAKTECDSEELVKAETALNRCQTLVDDLLTLAREGQSVAETETVSLEKITERCWKTVQTADATLNTDAEQAIVADRSRLQQLLENLVRNAIDHVGSDVTVELGCLEDGFYVADDGPGIPEDDRERVFESAYSTVQDNTGFGLAIVSEIVDAHGWDVAVTESASGGARFEITGVETN